MEDPSRRSRDSRLTGARVVLFDGVCALCDASVRWLMAADKGEVLHYAPLQGETARDVLARHPDAKRELSTVLYVRDLGKEGETVLDRSDAALEILHDLGGWWRRTLAALRWVPRPLRDLVYDFIAKRRYRWFGKYDECRLPATSDSSRFLP